MRILLIEDDTVLGAAVRDQIAGDGQSVDWVTRLDAAGDAVRSASYDLILLDLMLPDGRGIGFLKTLRARGDVTPVIILTALDQVSDRIEGLNAGADDYLVKPFDLAELSARIGSVARRYSGNPNPIITHGPLDIDLASRSIRREGKPVQLTAREWALLRGVAVAPGPDPVQGAAGGEALRLRRRGREQHDRGPCQPTAQEARFRRHRDRAGHGLSSGRAMRLPRSLQVRLALSLGILLTLLWIAAASVTAIILRHEMDEVFNSALQETAQRLLPLAVLDIVGREEDGVTQRLGAIRAHDEFFTYIVRDAQGRILLQSHAADPAVFPA